MSSPLSKVSQCLFRYSFHTSAVAMLASHFCSRSDLSKLLLSLCSLRTLLLSLCSIHAPLQLLSSHSSPPCLLRMCRLRLDLSETASPHTSHLTFAPRWTAICRCTLYKLGNALKHTEQCCSRRPSWVALVCRCSW